MKTFSAPEGVETVCRRVQCYELRELAPGRRLGHPPKLRQRAVQLQRRYRRHACSGAERLLILARRLLRGDLPS